MGMGMGMGWDEDVDRMGMSRRMRTGIWISMGTGLEVG